MSVKTIMMSLMFRMMRLPTCEEVDRFAYDFLDGTLEDNILKAVERHLRFCKSCQKFIAAYRFVAATEKPVTPPPLESEFKEKMYEFLRQQRKSGRD